MQFSMPAGALAGALGQVKGCVPTRSTIPILGHVLLAANGNGVSLRGTNLEMEATAQIAAEVATPGSIAIPGDVLHGIAKRWPKSDAATLVIDGNRAQVSCGRSRYTLRTLPPDDFPAERPIEDGATFEIAGRVLAEILGTTRYAAATDDGRYYLCGVHLAVAGDRLVATATDGHRLARRSCSAPEGCAGMPGVIIPTDAVREIVDLVGDIEGDVKVTVSDRRVRVEADVFAFSSGLVDGKYPDIDRVIPARGEAGVTVGVKLLAAALDRAAVVYAATDQKAPAARFVAGARGLDLIAGVDGFDKASEDVEATVHDRGAEWSVNVKYLADMLKQLPDCEVAVHVNGKAGPVVFIAADQPDALHLIMPQRA